MNCCNAYGHCTQGPSCAARSAMVASHSTPATPAHADNVWFVDSEHSPLDELTSPVTFSCEKIGYCMGRADCACVDGLELYSPLPATVARMAGVPSESGNSRILDDASDWLPLTTRDRIIIGITVAVFCVCWLVLIGIVLGYSWGEWLSAWAGEATRAVANGMLS